MEISTKFIKLLKFCSLVCLLFLLLSAFSSCFAVTNGLDIPTADPFVFTNYDGQDNAVPQITNAMFDRIFGGGSTAYTKGDFFIYKSTYSSSYSYTIVFFGKDAYAYLDGNRLDTSVTGVRWRCSSEWLPLSWGSMDYWFDVTLGGTNPENKLVYSTVDIYSDVNKSSIAYYGMGLEPNPYDVFSFPNAQNDLTTMAQGNNENFVVQVLNSNIDIETYDFVDTQYMYMSFYVLDKVQSSSGNWWYNIYSFPVVVNHHPVTSIGGQNYVQLVSVNNDLFFYYNKEYFIEAGFYPGSEDIIYCFLDTNRFGAGATANTEKPRSNERYFARLNTLVNLEVDYNFNTSNPVKVEIPTLTMAEEINNNNNQNSSIINNNITNLNNTITDSNVDSSSYSDISGLGSDFGITDNTGIEGLFLILYNAFCTDNIQSVTFNIPFVNKSFTINNTFSNNYPSGVVSIVHIFVWGVIALFVLRDIRSIINKVAEGNPENVGSDVKKDVLG